MATMDIEKLKKLKITHIEKKIDELNSFDARLLFSYTSRFSVYEDDENYFFYDKYWPNINLINKRKIN